MSNKQTRFEEGRMAFRDGKLNTEAPYNATETQSCHNWLRGWWAAHDEARATVKIIEQVTAELSK